MKSGNSNALLLTNRNYLIICLRYEYDNHFLYIHVYGILNFWISGAPAMTSRGMKEKDFEKICEFLDRGVQIGINAKKYSSKLSVCEVFCYWMKLMKKSLICDFRYDTCPVEHRNISSWSCLDYIFPQKLWKSSAMQW